VEAVTWAEADELALTELTELVAVTWTRKYLPTSLAAIAYEAVPLPVPIAEAQSVDPSFETCH
jgi:hypothetical protein